MKYFKVLIILVFLVAGISTLVLSGNETSTAPTPTTEELAKRYPIAPGVWYPTDGAVPEKPMRYYRIRCWPGCHTGSSLGKYPHKTLNDKPIYPTSTVDAHSNESSQKE